MLRKLAPTVLAVLIAFAWIQAAPTNELATPGPRVDSGIRAILDRTVAAIVRNDEDLPRQLEALRDPALGDRRTVLLQLMLYLESATGTEQTMAGAVILHHLAFTPEEKLRTVLPLLDAAGPGLRHVLTELLGTIDRPEGGEPDFRFYESWIPKQTGNPPWPLVRYLYEVSPDAALASMERVYGASPARTEGPARIDVDARAAELGRLVAGAGAGATLSPRDLARARTLLEALSVDPGWWRRLYAASILAAHPGLATPDMTRRLAGDANPVVRGMLNR